MGAKSTKGQKCQKCDRLSVFNAMDDSNGTCVQCQARQDCDLVAPFDDAQFPDFPDLPNDSCCIRCNQILPIQRFMKSPTSPGIRKTCASCLHRQKTYRNRERENWNSSEECYCVQCHNVLPSSMFVNSLNLEKPTRKCQTCRDAENLPRNQRRHAARNWAIKELDEMTENTEGPQTRFLYGDFAGNPMTPCPIENCMSHAQGHSLQIRAFEKHIKQHGTAVLERWRAAGGLQSSVSFRMSHDGVLLRTESDGPELFPHGRAACHEKSSLIDKVVGSSDSAAGFDTDALAKTIEVRNRASIDRHPELRIRVPFPPKVRDRKCLGPRETVNKCIIAPCPKGQFITLSTATILVSNPPYLAGLGLDPRCYTCANEFNMARELGKVGLLAGFEADGCCQTPECVRRRWNISILCVNCLMLPRHPHKKPKWQSTICSYEISLRDRIRGHQGPCPLEWQSTRQSLVSKQGRMIFLDLEFSTHKWNEIYSLGIVDSAGRVSCHILVDEPGSGGAGLPHNRFFDQCIRQKLKTQGTFTHVLKPAEVLKYLREIISPETIIIGWGVYELDLLRLRKWADVHGSSDFLPQQGGSPIAIPLAKRLLPGLPSYSMDFIFRALFPNDTLIEHAHMADVDALMCFKVVTYLLEAYEEHHTLPSVGKLQSTLPKIWGLSDTSKTDGERQGTTGSKAAEQPRKNSGKRKRLPVDSDQQSLKRFWGECSKRQTRSGNRKNESQNGYVFQYESSTYDEIDDDGDYVEDQDLYPREDEQHPLATDNSGDGDSDFVDARELNLGDDGQLRLGTAMPSNNEDDDDGDHVESKRDDRRTETRRASHKLGPRNPDKDESDHDGGYAPRRARGYRLTCG